MYLTYHVFVLNDQQYQNTEKLLIREFYTNSIRNDKLFPGGQKIMDSHLIPNLYLLDSLDSHDSVKFGLFRDSLIAKMVHELKAKNTMDTVFSKIKGQYGLGDMWGYALILNRIRLVFNDGRRVSFYPALRNSSDGLEKYCAETIGRIGGTLNRIRPQNSIIELSITSPQDYSYEVHFTLHADRSDRDIAVLKLISPVVIFGVVCVMAIFVVYLLTFKNWTRQEKLNEMKSDFVNSITHEFHTPISTILVASRTLNNQFNKKGSTLELSLIDVIERQTTRLQRLFSQVLDITSMSGDKLERERVELNSLLKQIIQDYCIKLSDSDTKVGFIGTTEVYVDLNPFFFTTMIDNLLDNGLKHNLKNVKTIQVALTIVNEEVKISLRDNGEGFPNKEASRIFDKFYRSKRTSTGGLGLGLYYVKQCVLVHGWTVNVESEQNRGSNFVVSIPNSKSK